MFQATAIPGFRQMAESRAPGEDVLRVENNVPRVDNTYYVIRRFKASADRFGCGEKATDSFPATID
jgi:hypothetical protein